MSTSKTRHSHRNPVRGPFNSWILAALEGHFHRTVGPARARVFGQLDGRVVDIGAGNGPTFRYLRPGVTVHAVEPNPHFHRRLRGTASKHGIELVLHDTPGEGIDLPDGSADAVITSWVLCTVADPEAVLAEVRRVLKPGGRYAFVEHVAAPPGSGVRRVQDAVFAPWRWMFEGCHTNRDTEAAIRAAGFASVEVDEIRVRTPFVPIRPQLAGVALK